MTIQRWQPGLDMVGGQFVANSFYRPDGRYVTHADHLAAMQQKDAVIDAMAESTAASLQREREVREKLVEALEAARVRVQLSDDEINKLDGEVSMSHTWHMINAALAAAKELE